MSMTCGTRSRTKRGVGSIADHELAQHGEINDGLDGEDDRLEGREPGFGAVEVRRSASQQRMRSSSGSDGFSGDERRARREREMGDRNQDNITPLKRHRVPSNCGRRHLDRCPRREKGWLRQSIPRLAIQVLVEYLGQAEQNVKRLLHDPAFAHFLGLGQSLETTDLVDRENKLSRNRPRHINCGNTCCRHILALRNTVIVNELYHGHGA